MVLEQISTHAIYVILLILCRIGTIIMIMPGIGELYVTPRARIAIAFFLALITFPHVVDTIKIPTHQLELFIIIFNEIIIGLFIGTIFRILVSVMSIVGHIIATQSGLASAMLFDPNQGIQGTIISNLLGLIAVLIIFVTDLDYIYIKAIFDSYKIFTVGDLRLLTDITENLVTTISASFDIAIKIASPQLVVGLLLFTASGILARLMPSLQIFFLLTPIQIMLSLFILMVTLSATTLWYLDFIVEVIGKFVG